MPYIKQEMRDKLDQKINDLMHAIDEATSEPHFGDSIQNDGKLDGALNYVMTRLLKHFYTDGLDAGGIPLTSYYRVNRAVGLIASVKTEFERKIVVPYETTKEFENGDVQ